ncbi:mannose-1-phosphate guanylyltransferase/phosphomannomutase [Melghirimyces profundicolus]|uniref:Mannose-1-phosphate guanylyltransferase/phosphomannomutase n=1 Tax=Melghirimyces profundicolus TaxID=1242148 RepID=A0A2T6BH34_9BACL|nr:sugar phosphate nucleotidyltransferase [Melghirimyces profundicolus]PTX55356.1 mannose-1-phosphate guanylyltransferase/phosphomannomutase [Melghirimyces profundicolus]
MKAVIMAGGKGTRLRPLTNRLPKPMVPLLDKPCMEYIIELLKRHGITDIAVTMQYLPQVIQSHFGDGSDFGVRLHYFEEGHPLGTAGSVKNAEAFLDDTFVVISGDALTDVDLGQAVAFHRERKTWGTLVLSRVEVPLEYGVVMTREDGKITRFLEKPSWSEVFSDTVNTGIYVMEPQILSLFEKGKPFDFSKDLFPLMMERHLPLYGHVAEAYWSDIGNLKQYRQAQQDLLEGRVQADIKGEEVFPGIWLGEGADGIDCSSVTPPVFIGAGSTVHPEAHIGPHTVLGQQSRVEAGAAVVRSVLWNRTSVGEASSLDGSTLTHGGRVGPGAILEEETVIGEGARIGEKVVLRSGVKIWPEKTVGAGTVLTESLVWEASAAAALFGTDGVSGATNWDLTPERTGRIVGAFASVLPPGSAVAVSCDETPFSEILKFAATASLMASGASVRDLGRLPVPVSRHAVFRSDSHAGIHIRRSGEEGDRIVIQFFDREGLPIGKSLERKVENALLQGDALRPPDGFGSLESRSGAIDVYRAELISRLREDAIRRREFKVVFHSENPYLMAVLQPLMDQLGCRMVTVWGDEPHMEHFVMDNQADLGVRMDRSGQAVTLFTETGYALKPEEETVLQTLLAVRLQNRVAVPVNAPSEAEELARRFGTEPILTATSARAVLEADRNRSLQLYFDGFSMLAFLLEFLAVEGVTVHRTLEMLPRPHIRSEKIPCPVEAKGKVMRRLMEEVKGQKTQLVDGIKVLGETGWALILPDVEKAHFDVVAQGSTPEQAERLKDIYKEKIESYQGSTLTRP